MDKYTLKNFAESIFTGNDINFHLMTKDGKWYDKEYTSEFKEVATSQKYGVTINDDTIDFDFKTGKNEDNIFKSFVSQFISKYESKRTVLIDGEVRARTKKEVLTTLKNNDRVSKYYFYTTLYGIGYFCFFSSAQAIKEVHNELASYLKTKNIEFKNEFSEAGWVYRFVINKDITIHNNLLTNLELK